MGFPVIWTKPGVNSLGELFHWWEDAPVGGWVVLPEPENEIQVVDGQERRYEMRGNMSFSYLESYNLWERVA